MTEEELKYKQEQFRKETEIAKFEAFSLMCQKVAELEQKLEQTEKDLADYQFNYPTIKALEQELADVKHLCLASDKINEQLNNTIINLSKENAELKETVMKMNDVITKTFSNLAKAKELLKKYVEWNKDSEAYLDLSEWNAEVEQFLKDSEVEK